MPEAAHAALQPVLHSGRLACGPQVAAFEAQLAAWLGVPGAVALNDSSGALALALYAAGVRPGDEVIVPTLVCAQTIMPVANVYAKPVWCDIDPATGMPTAAQIAEKITEKTKAILVYHWSGDVADMDAILALAKARGLKVVEEASEAFGAENPRGKRLGGEADFTVYSFYASKHINTGEGAIMLAAAAQDLALVRRLRRFGIEPSTLRTAGGDLNPQIEITLAGFNMQMNEIAATIGLAAMPEADRIVASYRANGRYYEGALRNLPGVRQLRREHGVSSYWTYSLLAERRDDLLRKLGEHGIGAQRLHVRYDGMLCFGGKPADLPHTAQFDAANISIPCGWWIGEAERERIAQCIRGGW